jgi:hypothetical protein
MPFATKLSWRQSKVPLKDRRYHLHYLGHLALRANLEEKP